MFIFSTSPTHLINVSYALWLGSNQEYKIIQEIIENISSTKLNGQIHVSPMINQGDSISFATCQWDYDLFLSFREEDTYNGFASHIYEALCEKGVKTFIVDEIQRGEWISMDFTKLLNFQWFQLSYFLKTTHFWLGDLKNLSRFLTESKIDNWFYLFFMKWIHLNYVSKKVISR